MKHQMPFLFFDSWCRFISEYLNVIDDILPAKDSQGASAVDSITQSYADVSFHVIYTHNLTNVVSVRR